MELNGQASSATIMRASQEAAIKSMAPIKTACNLWWKASLLKVTERYYDGACHGDEHETSIQVLSTVSSPRNRGQLGICCMQGKSLQTILSYGDMQQRGEY